jgi:hypothetical protein
MMNSVGLFCAVARSIETRPSSVFIFCCSGGRPSGAYAGSKGIDSSAANSGTASRGANASDVRLISSLCSFSAALSVRRMFIDRRINSMMGCSAPFLKCGRH